MQWAQETVIRWRHGSPKKKGQLRGGGAMQHGAGITVATCYTRYLSFSVLTLLDGWQEEHLACKNQAMTDEVRTWLSDGVRCK